METGYITLLLKEMGYDKVFKKYSSAMKYASKTGKTVEVIRHNCFAVV